MQHRRFKKFDHYGVDEPLNDLDKWGRGIQVPVTYYMMINDKAKESPKASHSKQREIQRRIDQPLQLFYTNEWELKEENNSTLSQTNYTLAAVSANEIPNHLANKTKDAIKESKESGTLKTLIFATD
jgi:hypothetical protein